MLDSLPVAEPKPDPVSETPPVSPPAEPPVVIRTKRGPPRPVIFAVGIVALFAVIALWITWALPLSKALEPMESPTLVLVASDGKAFARRGSYKEAPVVAEDLPEHVRMAFIAIEDRRFYRHMGIDGRAIGRALVRNMKAGEVEEGGSTITQQLAKNAFTSGDRTFRRKMREALIALYLESRLTKDEILSRYLSSVYFGEGVFGLRAAARHFFDKTPDNLTIGEAAMLAGVIKAPSRLAPIDNPRDARTRMGLVLDEMVDVGAITRDQATRAARNVRVRAGRPALPVGSWFADWVSPQAKDRFDRAYGEVVVETTLDSALQTRAEQVLRRALTANGTRLKAGQGALVAMRTDGQVVALVGGKDYKESQFNRAVQAKRQVGSAFKPFVYLAAFRRGATPQSLVLDAPIKIGDWSPENHEGRYTGQPVTFQDAFARSSNVAAVRVERETGVGAVIRAARDMGVTSDLPNDPTVGLGTGSMSLMELTAAYAGFAAGASPITPYGLAYEPPPPPRRTMRPHERAYMLQLMRAVVTSGTGQGASMGFPVYGKTGTTQNYRDAYFIGFAGDLVVGVWIGNDDNTPMRRVTGGSLPTQVWREFMGYAATRRGFAAPPLTAEPEPPPLEGEEGFELPPWMLDQRGEGPIILDERQLPPPIRERVRPQDQELPPFMRDPPPASRPPPERGDIFVPPREGEPLGDLRGLEPRED